MDTLAVRLAVPLTGSTEDFPFLGHFLGVRPAGRTKVPATRAGGSGEPPHITTVRNYLSRCVYRGIFPYEFGIL